MEQREANFRFQDLSHRAARRVIQRVFVLAGRSRSLREHIRTLCFETLWVIEDWDFGWTVRVDQGRLEFSRRPTKRPAVTFLWPALAEFTHQLEAQLLLRDLDTGFIHTEDPKLRKAALALYSAFIPLLRQVLADPFDEDGTPLIARNL
jgi:hypothetical protein